jgi:hypothetical protein
VPRLPHRLPARLGGLTAGAFTSAGMAWDVVIGGVPFLAGWDENDPHIRETAPWRKEQQDASQEAGEQSLGGWWYRSQASFHGGAGLTYLESPEAGGVRTRIRYDESFNIDPWTPGVLHRLPDTGLQIASGTTGQKLAAGRIGTTDYVVHAAGNALTALSITAAGVIATTGLTWGGTGTILALTTDGRRYAVADTTGVYSGPVDGSSGGTKIWNLTTPTVVVLAWVKQRLMAAIDRSVYELVETAGPALPTAKYTHPLPVGSWTWTAISEDPSSILVAGYAGGTSGILRFTLDDAGGVPVLTAGAEVAQMPAGEVIYAMDLHAGSFLGIGTSRGFRVGTFDTFSGRLKYGPLTLTLANGCRAVTGRGDFLYAGSARALAANTESGLLRVSVGQDLDDAGHKAYAADLSCPIPVTGEVTGVDVTGGGRLAFVVDGYGLVLEGVGPGSARTAWLRTSRIRYSTVEPKVYRYAQITGTFTPPAEIKVYVTAPGLAERQVLDWTGGTDPEQFNLADGPRQWLQLRFELIGATCELVSYSVKALPAASRQRILQYVLLCNDRESDRNGQVVNQTGFAWTRIQALEALEDEGAEVQVQELLPGEAPIIRRCVIDRITYRQSERPTRNASGRAGHILVLARTIS